MTRCSATFLSVPLALAGFVDNDAFDRGVGSAGFVWRTTVRPALGVHAGKGAASGSVHCALPLRSENFHWLVSVRNCFVLECLGGGGGLGWMSGTPLWHPPGILATTLKIYNALLPLLVVVLLAGAVFNLLFNGTC